ncbi:serine/threonine-protein kinase [Tautonia plasticadhaerens]|uniref:Serine/threonine-protein kinase PrkC n=1 Tax=Tautonia plasticadhaerens TaxID=2527974 RepID=A0A518HB99_9BACT|nr:serine/threonine-protein kinase [Tautonia plasticadhaerens]QDV38135.1 Serine/threonine-protein kinase PrkC [Tautonia plasticadhaerens]
MASTTAAPKLAKMDYEVVRSLGTGAGSTILLVRDKATGRKYALKVVRRQGPDDDIYVNQAMVEWDVARMLNHPNIVRVLDFRVKKSWFKTTGVELLLEYVDGVMLDDLLAKLPVPRLVAFFRRVADAMAHMHRRGVYHGDLKPGNLMITRDGQVKVIDFGTAWIRGEDKGRVQGTPYYMAPEQAQRKVVDEKTDVYNFGATMYRMFTGEYANLGIPGLDNGRANRARMKSPASMVPDLPKSLSDLIMDCIAPKPDRRPSGMQEVRERLDEIAAELGPKADDPFGTDAPE